MMPAEKSRRRLAVGATAVAIVVAVMVFTLYDRLVESMLARDTSAQAGLAVTEQKAQPLIAALERYRAAHGGLYPTTIDRLGKQDASTLHFSHRGFLYTGTAWDRVFVSDACAERDKALHGVVMEQTKTFERELAAFNAECVNGYRRIQLQSPDFHFDRSDSVERWPWSLGLLRLGKTRLGDRLVLACRQSSRLRLDARWA